jgi:hypothetical protein
MGGGDEGKSSDLPVGMTFDDEGLLASAGGDNDGEPQFEEYD